ncbi:pro-sigmaK processing inhibitor BofA family protein [Muricomes intestini]|jgi:inhibitor of the pro-sigma K processing machinery|uniref:Inhibitor of the pro-sigma K processing machinery n=1 Tax=Muricomes intestini TaxID=1796634 RepID=A0A4R3K993_9FIRM|nr:pro-sigmaK processing inhibitor BofA family protein [Muricomes intestini]TCS79469.1 inhibitor of the pro-sigma K processing machinery [Muricomes intestini]HAX51284.1 Pro-sigmaK processing inhibitor BofA [Lachnospiraceae bacterium]HCR82535.1 Pro-sigmaK processing inhibitor BofA [Lachnospiraceae bacterium]
MENKLASTVVNFVIRAVLGMGLIYLINQYLLHGSDTLSVGLNVVSFLTAGGLGIPGVCLLYGILFYQNL